MLKKHPLAAGVIQCPALWRFGLPLDRTKRFRSSSVAYCYHYVCRMKRFGSSLLLLSLCVSHEALRIIFIIIIITCAGLRGAGSFSSLEEERGALHGVAGASLRGQQETPV